MRNIRRIGLVAAALAILIAPRGLSSTGAEGSGDSSSAQLEAKVRETVERVRPAFVFIDGGSGVVISPDGYMLTNYHVAGKLPQWTVKLSGGKQFKADVVGKDAYGDICLLKLKDAKDLPFAEFGNSDTLETGEYVIAIGNPFMIGNADFQPTVTLGVVSAIHRFQTNYSDAIQTDASINPGNSGGPLFDLEGKLLGINGQIVFRYGNKVNTGVGFSIPAAQINRFLPKMKSAGGGDVHHGQINGIVFSPDWTDGKGALLKEVQKGSTAEKAGFAAGDLIVRVESYPVRNSHRAIGFILTWPEGATINVTVKRGEEEKTFNVVLDRNTLPPPNYGPPQPAQRKGPQPPRRK